MIYKYVRTGHGSTLKNAMEFESAWVGKDSAEYIAEDAAEDYFENHDGWNLHGRNHSKYGQKMTRTTVSLR